MVSHGELAKLFSDGAEKGTGSRMFIEGDTIYSYGHHFPIAKRTEWGYLFNSDEYSSSTSAHKGYVETAISGVVVHIMNCDIAYADKQIAYNEKEIEELRGKIQRARKDGIKEAYKERIEWLKEQNKLLKKYGGKK